MPGTWDMVGKFGHRSPAPWQWYHLLLLHCYPAVADSSMSSQLGAVAVAGVYNSMSAPVVAAASSDSPLVGSYGGWLPVVSSCVCVSSGSPQTPCLHGLLSSSSSNNSSSSSGSSSNSSSTSCYCPSVHAVPPGSRCHWHVVPGTGYMLRVFQHRLGRYIQQYSQQ